MTLEQFTKILTTQLTCYGRYFKNTDDFSSRNNILALAAGFAEGVEVIAHEMLGEEAVDELHDTWRSWANELCGIES